MSSLEVFKWLKPGIGAEAVAGLAEGLLGLLACSIDWQLMPGAQLGLITGVPTHGLSMQLKLDS